MIYRDTGAYLPPRPRIYMLVHVSKSVRCLAIASCFAGISGCASDVTSGYLNTLYAIGIPGADSSSAVALGVIAARNMIITPLLSGAGQRGNSPTASSPVFGASTTPGATAPGAAPAQGSMVANMVAQETVEKYLGQPCDYLQQSLAEADQLIASSVPEAPKVGAAKKAAVTQALEGRNCP